ncbi:L-aminoadipate-semialdehyde dehydrogenase-phosphopantetheinyl transferase [Tetranychus urticae]|nr:L-aminoadipate-semialdehyde dehydrogenase-phosphopantetheinyl transferase [Tetranychus urticae]XP_025016146.1 L-aminoadipate-semialdehyde dehydrogenase-phosphopantetheinyl transferase [Tetranychus urticae]
MQRNGLRWIFNCRRWSPSRDDLLAALSCIQEEERDRIFKFYYKKDVKHALIGRLMLRKCVSDCLNINNDQILFTRTDKGKPVLAGQQTETSFDYNISHDGDYCVLAADWISKVGVDISRVKESKEKSTNEYFKTMERIFSHHEWLYIKDTPTLDQSPLHRFHRLWALKESFVKAEAIGIGYELRRIRFECPTECLQINKVNKDTLVYLDDKLSTDWLFEESVVDDKHVIAVALSGDQSILQSKRNENNYFKLLKFEDLITSSIAMDVSECLWNSFDLKEEGRYD